MHEYPQRLVDAVDVVLESWLCRSVIDTARRSTLGCSPELFAAAHDMSTVAAPRVMRQLRELLEADVDEQRSNPLSVLREAVHFPTEVLRAAGITPVRRDDFAVRAFPNDEYNLSPATWVDVDPSLQEPGLMWGAWKAQAVLERRHTRDNPRQADQ